MLATSRPGKRDLALPFAKSVCPLGGLIVGTQVALNTFFVFRPLTVIRMDRASASVAQNMGPF